MSNDSTPIYRKRPFVRIAVVLAAITVGLLTCLIAVYLVLPELAISHALNYEHYDGQRGVELALDHREKMSRKHPGQGGGWKSPTPIDSERRYFVVALPWTKDPDNPTVRFTCWAILDSMEERIIGSLRFPSEPHTFCGVICSNEGD